VISRSGVGIYTNCYPLTFTFTFSHVVTESGLPPALSDGGFSGSVDVGISAAAVAARDEVTATSSSRIPTFGDRNTTTVEPRKHAHKTRTPTIESIGSLSAFLPV